MGIEDVEGSEGVVREDEGPEDKAEEVPGEDAENELVDCKLLETSVPLVVNPDGTVDD